jgi:competence protein ComEC
MQTAIVLLGMNLEAVQKEHSISRRLSQWNKPDTLVIRGELEDEPSVHGKTVRMILRGVPSWENQHSDSSVRRFIVIASARKFIGLTSRWNIGHAVAIQGTLDEFPRPRNPGEFDYGKYLTLNEIDGIVWLADTLPAPPPSGKWNPGIWFASQRAGFGEIFDGLHGPQQAGFLRGVVFGDRREIPTELKESFVNTGTIHILAVSGSNVAMIALGLYMILGIFRIPKHWIVALTILGLLYYMMVTGASSSIVRATIMGCVILIGQMLERRSDVYNSLSVSAMIILLLSPSQLFDTGFQLSFAAVLSIVAIYPRLNTFIRRIPSRFEEIKAVDSVLKLFAVSLAAQLGTLPFTAYYFERFSVVSLAANLVVVPLVGVNLMLGCLTLIASAVSSWIAASYAALNEVLVSFLLGFVQAAASVPYAAVETAGFSLTSATIFYLCLVCALNPGSRAVLKAGVAGLLIVGIVSTIPFLTLNPGGTLRVTALDVGQGDAILIEFPNKTTMLIDAGPKDPGYDAGERILLPFLKRRGITRIDRLIVSHPHSDHIGGMPSLLAMMSVGMIMEADTATASRLHRSVRTTAGGGTEWRRVHMGTELSPDPSARVYCLSPSALSDPNLNNRSVVVKVIYGQTSVLLSGDAEKEAEKDVYRRFGSFLDSDILKAGHHGSSTSSSSPFLDSITPNFAIISVGKRNKFGHPSPDVVRELERRETRVLRTDREGAIIFESDGTRWEQRHWRTEEPH